MPGSHGRPRQAASAKQGQTPACPTWEAPARHNAGVLERAPHRTAQLTSISTSQALSFLLNKRWQDKISNEQKHVHIRKIRLRAKKAHTEQHPPPPAQPSGAPAGSHPRGNSPTHTGGRRSSRGLPKLPLSPAGATGTLGGEVLGPSSTQHPEPQHEPGAFAAQAGQEFTTGPEQEVTGQRRGVYRLTPARGPGPI